MFVHRIDQSSRARYRDNVYCVMLVPVVSEFLASLVYPEFEYLTLVVDLVFYVGRNILSAQINLVFDQKPF